MLTETHFSTTLKNAPIMRLAGFQIGDETGAKFAEPGKLPRFRHRAFTFDFRAFLGGLDGKAIIRGLRELAFVSDIWQESALADGDFYGDVRNGKILTMIGGEPVWM
jgi:hypothetical protein